jgi:glutamine cyclotransferase
MKKLFIILIIVGLLAALVLPLLNKGNNESETAFSFSFNDNVAVEIGKVIPLAFEVTGDLNSISLEINGENVKTWKNPSGNIDYKLNTNDYHVGSFTIELIGISSDGMTQNEQRLLRILSDIKPEKWTTKINGVLPHLETSFTQGLEFDNGTLYEGTGDPNQDGQTLVAEVDLKTGVIKRKMGLDASHFGEGISVFGDELFQLTWKNQKCLVYDKKSFKVLRELAYSGEGWGLCHDNNNLIMSDGSERIYFRDPKTFEITKTIEAYTDQGPVAYLNELEYIDGFIYANIWTTNNIAVIAAESGKVVAIIDATELVKEGKGNGEVLNGIAFDKLNKKLYMTGKYWPKLFEVSIGKKAA